MKMRLMLPSALALTVSAGLAAAQPGFIQQCGTASWYALTSQTANGETANPDALTAAHKSLPFGTTIRVENLQNGRALKLRINDRGPFVGGRIVDVSRAAADRLGFKHQGTVRVRVTIADRGDGERLRGCS